MSGGLAPSKSTLYVGNLPYELTNNDITQIFEKYGKIGKVTILRDKVTRESKGVAFILFVDRASAHRAIRALNRKELFGRTLKVSIASDNGRAPEFIKRKVYKDKSRCYECGETGHLSYNCPKNALGDREVATKKPKKRRNQEGRGGGGGGRGEVGEEEDEGQGWDEEEEEDYTLGDAIRMCQEMRERETVVGEPSYSDSTHPILAQFHETGATGRRTIKPDSYFSDEDASDRD